MTYSMKHLQYLVALAEEKSFSKAALQSHVTQSTLSLGIKELERQMNTALFERSRKNIIPTAAGQKAVSYAKEILKTSRSLASEMQIFTNPDAGPLRIGVIPTIAPYLLPQAIPILEDIFPASHVQIAEDTTETILHKIKGGRLDLGIIAFPVNTHDLEQRILFSEDFILAAPDAMSVPDMLTIDMLDKLDILLLREGHCLKDHVLSACHLPPEKQNRFFEAESLHTLLAMVNQGYGCTLIPEMAVNANLTTLFPHIKIHPFLHQSPSRQIGLVWRRADVRHPIFSTLSFPEAAERKT